MIELTDATGERLRLEAPPRRVISLVPSTTETLFALDGPARLVGVTRYCVHPARARQTARVVGGTKSPRIDLIQELEPDLILSNLEENRKQDVAELRRFATVYVAFPRDLTSAIREIVTLGTLLGRQTRARRLEAELTQALEQLRETSRDRPRFRFLYLIWKNPYMAVGPGTFIDAFLAEAGGENVMGEGTGRYPAIHAHHIEATRPDVVLLSSEPFPFNHHHVDEILEETGDPDAWRGRILLVDGQLLSWHGVRLIQGIAYLSELADRFEELAKIAG